MRNGDFKFAILNRKGRGGRGPITMHIEGTDYKFPHTAMAGARREAKQLIKGNSNMREHPVEVRIRERQGDNWNKGPVKIVKTTWGKLADTAPSKLLK